MRNITIYTPEDLPEHKRNDANYTVKLLDLGDSFHEHHDSDIIIYVNRHGGKIIKNRYGPEEGELSTLNLNSEILSIIEQVRADYVDRNNLTIR